MKPLVIFHEPCNDGFTAAWVVNKFLGGHAEFYPARHGTAPPDCTGRDVIMLDFSFPKENMEVIAQQVNTLIIIDHHQTAHEAVSTIKDLPNVICNVVEGDESGAKMAWKYFFPNRPVPHLVNIVSDNDIWKFELPDTKPLIEYIRMNPQSFENHDIYEAAFQDNRVAAMIVRGQAALDTKMKFVQDAMKLKHEIDWHGHKVWAVNLPYFLTSDAGHELVGDREFAIVYGFDGSQGKWKISGRSNDFDLTTVGLRGHPHAAGMTVDHLPWVPNKWQI
jgi:hypothetical protein